MAEQVVLCGPDGAAVGVMDKGAVHTTDTPLHLAFSCYLFDAAGRLLVTRRARSKSTWPGVRTNSCCGHPAPGEDPADAVSRRLRYELGVAGADIDLILPRFRYRAVMDDGTVENELCPLYRAVVRDPVLALNPAEVDDAWWVDWSTFVQGRDERDDADLLSPWCAMQVDALRELGADPARWPTGDTALLPAAAG